jgi:predicted nucleotidyltransferase
MTAKTYRAVKDLNEVIDRIKARKAYLQKRFKVRTIAVFGSFIHGEQKRGSDVDVLVEFEEVQGFDFFALWDYLERVLKKKIDLTTKSALRKEITGKVLNEAVYI